MSTTNNEKRMEIPLVAQLAVARALCETTSRELIALHDRLERHRLVIQRIEEELANNYEMMKHGQHET